MPRGTYAVQARESGVTNNGVGSVVTAKQRQRDNSYKSCIHAMVIFVILCIILMLAAWPWKKASPSTNGRSEYGSAEGHSGSKLTTTLLPAKTTTEQMPRTMRITTSKTTLRSTTTSTTETPTTTEPYHKHPFIRPDVDPKYNTDAPDETVTPSSSTTVTTPMSTTDRKTTREGTTIESTQDQTELGQNVPHQQGTTTLSDVMTHPPSHATTIARGEDVTQTTLSEQQVEDSYENKAEGTTETEATVEQFTRIPLDGQQGDKGGVTAETTTDSQFEIVSNNDAHLSSSGELQNAVTTIQDTSTMEPTNPEGSQPSTIARNDQQTGEESTTTEVKTTTSSKMSTGDVTEATDVVSETDAMTTTDFTDIVSTTPSPDATCASGQCKVLASRMLSLMNHTVDACEDFYQYACGGMRSNKALKEDAPQEEANSRINAEMQRVNETSHMPYQKFKHFYEKCLGYDHLVDFEKRRTSARKVFDTVGKMHTKTSWTLEKTSFTDLLSRLMLKHSTPIMDVTLDVDGQKPTRFALRLTPPIFSSMFSTGNTAHEKCKNKDIENVKDFNKYYEDYIHCTSDYSQYVKEVQDAIKSLRLFKTLDPFNFTQIVQEILTSIEWDILKNDAWGETELPRTGERNRVILSKQYDTMTIGELQSQFTLVDWKLLFGNLLRNPGAPLKDETIVQVYFKSYFQKLFRFLQAEEQRKLHNSLLAMYARDLYVDLVVPQAECARETYCLHVASSLMEDVAASLYLSSFENATLRAMRSDAEQLFAQLRTAMQKELTSAQWLDGASKSNALAKLASMRMAVDGGVSVFLNEAFLDEDLSEVSVREDNYLNLAVSLQARYREKMYSMYAVDPQSSEAMWSQFLLPHKTQPVSVYALNTIVIPYGLMTWPLYEPGLPRYLRMARLGFVIAHEIAHHFDSVGVSYSGALTGKTDPIFSGESLESFNEYQHCPIDSYNFLKTYTTIDGTTVNYMLNSMVSLNERLADNTAAKLAYDAYKQWVPNPEPSLPWIGLSVEKLFFIALSQTFCTKATIFDYGVSMFEDPHLPPVLRVHNILQNSIEFSEVFTCAVGGKINVQEKCEVFPKLTSVESNVQNFVPQPS